MHGPKRWGDGDHGPGEKDLPGLQGLGIPFASATGASGADSRTDLAGGFAHIEAYEDNGTLVAYEFYTSDHFGNNANGTYGEEQLPGPLTQETAPSVQCSVTRLTVDGRRLRQPAPVFSDELEPADQEWDYQADTRIAHLGTQAVTTDVTNRQKISEYEVFHADGATWSAAGMARGYGGKLGRYSCWHTFRLTNTWSGMEDIGQDIVPTRIDRIRMTRSGSTLNAMRYRAAEPEFDQAWVFSRHATSRVIGGQLFFIMTDNYGRMYVYKHPTGSANEPHEYSVVSSYWMGTPPYPAWVSVPDPTDQWMIGRTWLWEFSSDGTRAVCCPFKSVAGPLKRIGNNIGVLTDGLLAQIDASSYAASSVRADLSDTSGLVEIGIEITNTGDGLDQFEVALTLLRSDHFEDSGRFYLNAAYSLPDKSPAGMANGERLATDTLLTAELRLTAPAGDINLGPAEPWDVPPAPALLTDCVRYASLRLRLQANDDEMGATLLREMLVADNVREAAMTPAAFEQWLDMTGPQQALYGQAASVGTSYPSAADPMVSIEAWSGATTGVHVFEPPLDEAGDDGMAYRLGFLYAMELRTLSLRYTVLDSFTGTRTDYLVVYNTLDTEQADDFITLPAPINYVDGAATTEVRSAPILTSWSNFFVEMSHWAGFSAHPAGHWAIGGGQFNFDAEQDCNDIIAPRGGQRTSHRAAFNQAFGQDRHQFYYTWTAQWETDASLIEPKSTLDRGSFRVGGSWFTCRK